MRKRLFGLNCKLVDKFIDEMKAGFTKREDEVLKRLEALENEKNDLETELQSLINEKESCGERRERLELALIRAEKIASLMDASAKDEIYEIQDNYKEKMLHYEEIIQQNMEGLKHAADDVDRLIDIIRDMDSNIKDIIEGQDYQKIPESLKFKIIPYIARQKNKAQKTEALLPGQIKREQQNPPEQDKQKSKVPGANEYKAAERSFWEVENIDAAADGTKVVTMPEKHAAYLSKHSFKDNVIRASLNESRDTCHHAQMSEGFWDSTGVFEEISAASSEHIPGLSEEKSVQESGDHAQPAQEEVNNKNESKKESFRTESPALTKDIEGIRQRYIIGKLAGEDLYDTNNSLIIAKNQAITADVISRAEQEGKLSELIVNMIIPGMELS